MPRNWGRATAQWLDIDMVPAKGPIVLTNTDQTLQWLHDAKSAPKLEIEHEGETVKAAYWAPVRFAD